jgi:hypothetical protein
MLKVSGLAVIPREPRSEKRDSSPLARLEELDVEVDVSWALARVGNSSPINAKWIAVFQTRSTADDWLRCMISPQKEIGD